MKAVYPIILTPGEKYTTVYIPDFNINTEGTDIADAMEMARDAIGIMGIDMEDDKEPIPEPSTLDDIAAAHPDDVVTLVDIDFAEYRRRNDMRTVRRNVSLPSWLNAAAVQANLNVSAVLQAAIKDALGLAVYSSEEITTEEKPVFEYCPIREVTANPHRYSTTEYRKRRDCGREARAQA